MIKSMKVILAATGVAVLASPIMGQTLRDANIPVSTDNVFWGLAVAPLYGPAYGRAYGPAYGSVARVPAGRFVPGSVATPLPLILDCVHVPFPQCSGGGAAQ
jgi:hypothetical protein